MTETQIMICDYSIDSVEDHRITRGKALLKAFLRGPSDIHTSITIKDVESNEPDSSDKSDSSKDNEHQSDSNKPEQSSENNTSATNDSFRYSSSFTIYEAYKKLTDMRHLFEADGDGNNDSGKSQPSESEDSQSSESNKDKRGYTDEDEKDTSLVEKSRLKVSVISKGMGHSVWELAVCTDSSAKKLAIKTEIKAGRFAEAIEKSRVDGVATLVPLSLKTYISKENIMPLIGNCNWAVDSGNNEDKAEDDVICLAIAPINLETGSTKERLVFSSYFNIVGGDLLKYATGNKEVKTSNSEDDSRSYDRDKGNNVSQLLNNKFKNCVGNSSMSKEFKEITKFLNDQLDKHNIEYDEHKSTSPDQYAKIAEVNNSLICY